ncbi:hypothetical protein Lser_V15G18902 [Lactuca serriola]
MESDLLVSHPIGTSTKIEIIGNMNLLNSLTLFDVFVVPDFNVNLLYVHMVCKDSNCEVIFNEHSCKIQGLQSKEVIGNGREFGGLYYINSVPLEPILTSVFLINRTPTSILNGASPYELVYNNSSVFDKLRVFGSLCFATKLNNSDKFSKRANKCIFLGYSSDKNGYKVLSLNSNLVLFLGTVIKFYESVFPFKLKSSSSTDKSNVTLNSSDLFSYGESLHSSTLLDNTSLDNLRSVHQSDAASAYQNLDETCPYNVSNQTNEAHVPSPGVTFPCFSTLTEESISINTNPYEGRSTRFIRSGRDVHMPVSYSKAALDPNWIKAMNEEIYRARLVANGYNQREVIDYEEIFSPIAKIVTVRIVISLVVYNSWPLYQLHITNVFYMGTFLKVNSKDIIVVLLVYIDDIIITAIAKLN